MRYAWIPVLLVALAGCHQYDGRYAPPPSPEMEAPAEAQVPAGKMWVQDSETGEYVLIDDPNAPAPEEQVRPAPRRSRVPLPPSPRTVARRVRDGIPRPYAPRVPTPRPIHPNRPRFDISLEAWGMEVAGTAAGHPDWPAEEADLHEDLDIDTAAAVTLDLGLIFPRGPRFNMAFTAVQGEGEYAPYVTFPPGEEIVPSMMRLFLFDLSFTPMARGEKWGSIAMEVGARYARASIDIFGSQRFAEGTMLTLGGDLELALQRQTLYGDLSASVGLGPDCAGLQFDTGVSLKASRFFHMRLGYRFLGLVLYDRMGEDGERRLSTALGGPTLEMGFTF